MTKKNKLKRKIRTLFLSIIAIMILVLMYYSSENMPVVGKFFDFLKNILWYFQISHTFEYTIPASNLQPGEVVGYRSYAMDTSGNWNARR